VGINQILLITIVDIVFVITVLIIVFSQEISEVDQISGK